MFERNLMTDPGRVLSPCEIRLVRLYAQGKSDKEIAGEMHWRPATVKVYGVRIRKKLGMAHGGNPRVRLVLWGRKNVTWDE